jgi:hypothetical protein
MSRKLRLGGIAAALAVTGVLLLPASGAGAVAGDGPVAHKSGALINFVSTGKLRVARVLEPLAACTASCNVTGTAVLKGLGGHANFADSGGPFPAGTPFGLFITLKKNSVLFKLMKQFPGRFHLTETLTATDATTGAVDSVTAGFRFKR